MPSRLESLKTLEHAFQTPDGFKMAREEILTQIRRDSTSPERLAISLKRGYDIVRDVLVVSKMAVKDGGKDGGSTP